MVDSWIQILPSQDTGQDNPYYQAPVENSTTTAPPDGATAGSRYLLVNAQAPDTVFTNYRYYIAVRTPLGWDFVPPLEGMVVYDKALDQEWTYSIPGYWVLRTSVGTAFATLTGLPSDNVALAAALDGKSPTSHNHTGVYSPVGHDHAGVYSPSGHNHDTTYAALAHDHAGVYSPVAHTHTNATTSAPGFMSTADKAKLDGLTADGATVHGAFVSSANQTVASGASAVVGWDSKALDPENAFTISSGVVGLRVGKTYLVNWTISGYGNTAYTKSKATLTLQQGQTSWSTVANSAASFQTPESANADNQVFTQSGYSMVVTTGGDDRSIRLHLAIDASWGGIVIDKDKSRMDVLELTAFGAAGGGSGAWGFITGTIANQTDLQNQFAGYSQTSHVHAAATTGVAGFLSAADKTKLDGIDVSADVNLTGEQTAALLDTYLGSTAWRTGGNGDSRQASYYTAVQSAQIAAGATANVNFDTASYLRSGLAYTVSNGEITITEAGTFYFLAQIGAVSDVSNTKSVVTLAMQTDAAGSFATIPGATAILPVFNQTSTTAYQSSVIGLVGKMTFATAGKKVRVTMSPVAGWAAVKTASPECWIQIFKESPASAGGGGGGGTPGGANRQAQFNNAGTFGGAAGVEIRSPAATAPGRTYADHLLHANTYTCGYYQETVASGGSFWPDSYHDMAYELTLNGPVTLKGGNIKVANANELSAMKVYLKNNTAAAIQVSFDTASGQFDEVINIANPYTLAANTTRIVYCTARRNNANVLRKAVEG